MWIFVKTVLKLLDWADGHDGCIRSVIVWGVVSKILVDCEVEGVELAEGQSEIIYGKVFQLVDFALVVSICELEVLTSPIKWFNLLVDVDYLRV